ncbi:hypothetical protein [Methylophaga sp.]|uniref:hypothetical protein n=1 Tax=Methylophaga sp. TaxID=2024840 RepID=UPI003A8F7D33
MSSIATLTIDLIGKSGKLSAELKKATKNTQSWADKTRKLVGTSTKAMVGFGAAGVAAYASIYAKNAEFIDLQAKTADRLGITTQALGGLQHAANLYGASNEELTKSLQRMQQGLGQVAQTGTGEAKYALEGLGLAIEDLQGLAPEEQFKVIADKLKDVEDQSQKVYIAQSLMGKSGVKMINLMDAGADGISAMMQEAEDLGMTFDRIDAAKVEMANDAFDKAQKTTHSFGQTLAIETAPIIGAISDMWTESAKEAGGFGSIAQQVVTKVASGIGFLADMGRGLQVIFLLLRQGVAELANVAVQRFADVARAINPVLEALDMESSGLKQLEEFGDSFSATTANLAKELSDLVMEPMPSEKIKTWIADVQTKFEAVAQEQVNNPDKKDLSDLLVNSDPKVADEKAQRLIDSARNQYQQIFDAQLEAEGKEVELENKRFERKQAEMEREFQLLRDKNLITAEIEAEYNIAKEQALSQHEQRVSEIKKEQLELRAEKEKEHQQKLADIETDRKKMMQEGYGGLLDVMGGYFDGMEGKNASYAKSAMAIGETMLDEEKRNSLQSIWTNTYDTAMKAYNALADIPYVGPVLGAAAAGVVIAAGGMYAGKVSGLASFDGGGYTWDGPRTGGLDGKGGQLAMLHPQETVVDHTKGQSLGSSVTVNLFEDASRAGSTTRSSGPSGEEVINIFVTSIRQGGEASSVLENTYGLQRQGF